MFTMIYMYLISTGDVQPKGNLFIPMTIDLFLCGGVYTLVSVII
jgi:hypothetical protein